MKHKDEEEDNKRVTTFRTGLERPALELTLISVLAVQLNV